MCKIDFSKADIAGQTNQFSVVRADIPYEDELPVAVRNLLLSGIEERWKPLMENRLLLERDADLEWNWEEDVLYPKCYFLGTRDEANSSVLYILRNDGSNRVEGIARLIHGAPTFHLTKKSTRRGTVPVRPKAIYLDAIAVAPWNRVSIPPPERTRDLAKILLGVSITISKQMGFGGRVTLHAADTAEKWYRQIIPNAKFEYDRAELRGLQIQADDPAPKGPYIEIDAEVAHAFLSVNRMLLSGVEPIGECPTGLI